MLSVFAEQVVTALKNLQLHQEHEKIILGSIASIGNLLKKQSYSGLTHAPVYMEIVEMLGRHLKVSSDGIKQLEYASLLHDIGIIDVPYDILTLKRGKLSPAKEFELYPAAYRAKRGADLSRRVPPSPCSRDHFALISETWYAAERVIPSGLKKEQIPLGAPGVILSVVDRLLKRWCRARPYRSSLSVNAVIAGRIGKIQQCLAVRSQNCRDAFVNLASQKKFRKLLSLLKA